KCSIYNLGDKFRRKIQYELAFCRVGGAYARPADALCPGDPSHVSCWHPHRDVLSSRSGVKGSSPSLDAALLPPMQTPQQLSNTFGQVAKAIEPAVVNVSSESTPKPSRRGNNRRPNRGQENGEDPFQDFFDRFFGGPQGPGGD